MTDRLPDDELALPPGAPPDVDAKLAAALERVGQALRVQMWDRAKQHGLSPTQLQVLLRLASDPPARRRIGVWRPSSTSPTRPSRTPSRCYGARDSSTATRQPEGRLNLSARGQALAAELTDWDQRTRRQLAELPVGDKHATLRLLLELIAGLQRSGAITVARMCVTCRFFRRDAHPESPRPHHCALVDAPMGVGDLRVDCAEHEPRSA